MAPMHVYVFDMVLVKTGALIQNALAYACGPQAKQGQRLRVGQVASAPSSFNLILA